MNKREYNEQYRLAHKDDYARYQRKYYRENSKRILAQRVAKRAVELGVIEKTPCVMCGDMLKPVLMVHDDYSQQLEVTWLCADCMKQIEDEVNSIEVNIKPYDWSYPLTTRRGNNE